MNEFIKIEKSADRQAFSTDQAEWKEIFRSSSCSPFLSWEWLSIWFDSFGADKSPFILKAYRGCKLIGILPMFRETRGFAGMKSQRLALMGEGVGGADHLDVIARPADRVAVMTAFFEYINRDAHSGTLCFENLTGGSTTADLLTSLGETSGLRFGRVSRSVSAVCPQIDLAGGWPDVLAHSRRADNFKRKLKKLQKLPGFEFRSITVPDETGPAFERFLNLHQKRWEQAGGSELSGHPRLIAFQRRLVSELSVAGLIRFDELWLDGGCRSSIYGLDDGRSFYYYNSGYDQELSNLSVGLALLGLSIQSAVLRGNLVYDFLRGDETYKSDWANQRTELVSLNFSRNTLPVIAKDGLRRALTGLKGAAKYALPSSVAESVGNWRRSKRRSYQLSER